MDYRYLLAALLVVLVHGILILETRATGAGPSFDCSNHNQPEERAICASAELSRLDQQLADAYEAAKSTLAPEQLDALRKSQLDWIRNWRKSCGSKRDCLKEGYGKRLVELQPYVTPSWIQTSAELAKDTTQLLELSFACPVAVSDSPESAAWRRQHRVNKIVSDLRTFRATVTTIESVVVTGENRGDRGGVLSREMKSTQTYVADYSQLRRAIHQADDRRAVLLSCMYGMECIRECGDSSCRNEKETYFILCDSATAQSVEEALDALIAFNHKPASQ
jgi:uncharacterized protein